METKEFSTLHVNHLGINDAYGLFKESVDIAEPVQSLIGDLSKALLSHLTADVHAFGLQLKVAQKSGYTTQLTAQDKQRDDDLADIKRDIVYHLKGRDAGKKAAAERLKLFFDPFWSIEDEALVTETKSLQNLMAKYSASDALKADATLLGIDTKLAALDADNKSFDALYMTRNAEEGDKSATESGSSLRPAATKSYNDFCTAIEQAVSYTPNDTLISLFNRLEELRKKYRALISTPKDDDKNKTDTNTTK